MMGKCLLYVWRIRGSWVEADHLPPSLKSKHNAVRKRSVKGVVEILFTALDNWDEEMSELN